MEAFLREQLGLTSVRATRIRGGGCISDGAAFEVDDGKLLFVKSHSSVSARAMFEGEMASLEAIRKTGTIQAPQPIKVLDHPRGRGSMLVMEHVPLQSLSDQAGQLGERIARLHLHNPELEHANSSDYKARFGFHVPTYCGSICQGNQWDEDWPRYYANKLEEQFTLLKRNHRDEETLNLWTELAPQIPDFFELIKDDIRPSLLHGDLWSGNTGQAHGEPAIFDAGSFYGHHEFDLGIATIFSLPRQFFDAYHGIIPKASGFEGRQKLYQLFHYLNHWNLFGNGYKSSCTSIMKKLIK